MEDVRPDVYKMEVISLVTVLLDVVARKTMVA